LRTAAPSDPYRIGALDGSAEINVWLHQAMTKLAEGGG